MHVRTRSAILYNESAFLLFTANVSSLKYRIEEQNIPSRNNINNHACNN